MQLKSMTNLLISLDITFFNLHHFQVTFMFSSCSSSSTSSLSSLSLDLLRDGLLYLESLESSSEFFSSLRFFLRRPNSSYSSSSSRLSLYSTTPRSLYPPPYPVRSSISPNFGALHILHCCRRAQLTLPHLLHCQSSAL